MFQPQKLGFPRLRCKPPPKLAWLPQESESGLLTEVIKWHLDGPMRGVTKEPQALVPSTQIDGPYVPVQS